MKQQKKYTPTSVVMERIKQTILSHLATIPGATPYSLKRLQEPIDKSIDDSLTVEWQRSWGVSCSLSFRLSLAGLETTADGQRILTLAPEVLVFWSSTGRSPAASRAALALYSAVTDLACLLEAQAQEFGDIADLKEAQQAASHA